MNGPERRHIRRPSIPPAVSLGSLFAHQGTAVYFDARRPSTLPPHALSPPFCLPGMRWNCLPVNVLRVLQDGPGGFSQASSYLQPLFDCCRLFFPRHRGRQYRRRHIWQYRPSLVNSMSLFAERNRVRSCSLGTSTPSSRRISHFDRYARNCPSQPLFCPHAAASRKRPI
ncbi:uncharacterized protein SCHCODRAFT_02081526 [Schizophyllum commune H4-8]|uniref:uncharacterized protein n=1 Tax=Schizophyllum commune (strain H4-8 / FGSC 9210) TaxID=578458 RepID=UPI00215EB1FD|nr:uncharacterized protein SCHCODRAFT_02081526 [Schizophyllum commune H4-8]KAI5886806.1 hypothetical protein SCHCODRAFT_02081526 [Schizophyllum commune H4-8]